jgi:N-acetylmuramic acid 6-phosphate etherase
MDYASLSTEKVNLHSARLDRLSPIQIVRLMNREDRQVLRAVAQASPSIARVISLIVTSLQQGGRLIFVGAGTSGRLGVIEAAECPPTFGTSPLLIPAIMAGGKSAVFRSKEGSEDSESDAVSACRRIGVGRNDLVIGIAASGVTPFVQAALRFSRARKAQTVLLTCNPEIPRGLAQMTIALRTGPEVLAGSTRLKAGTACKMVLNMLTTASMVRIGKVYGNRMVDLQPKSRKLVERGIFLIRQLGGVNENEARRLFKTSDGRVKAAILMARKKIERPEAARRLARANGFLREALA